jgi:hypothetical protein
MSFFGFGILTSEGNISAPVAEALLSGHADGKN